MPDNETPVPGMAEPGPPLPATPAPGGQPPAVPAQPADDWQKRFTGLQDSLNATLKRTGFQSLKDIPLAAQVTEWQAAALALGDLQKKEQGLAADFEIQSGELSGLRAENQKLKLLAGEHPELMGFHAYIPTEEDETAQKAAIAAFQTTLGAFTKNTPQGAPPPPGGGYPAGGADLKAEVNQARAAWDQATMSGKASSQEIEAARQKYLQLDAQYRKQNGLPDPFAAPRARDIG